MNEIESKEVFKFVINTHKALSQILRFSTIPTMHKQNVAEHSYFVAFIAWLICIRLETNGITVDVAKVLKLCLIHDLPESISGDMPRSVKQGEVRRMIQELEDKVFEAMVEELPDDILIELLNAYRRWDAGDSVEQKIMRFSDILESAMYCLCEREMGNTNMDRVIDNMIIWLSDFENDLMESLVKEYKRRVKCVESL